MLREAFIFSRPTRLRRTRSLHLRGRGTACGGRSRVVLAVCTFIASHATAPQILFFQNVRFGSFFVLRARHSSRFEKAKNCFAPTRRASANNIGNTVGETIGLPPDDLHFLPSYATAPRILFFQTARFDSFFVLRARRTRGLRCRPLVNHRNKRERVPS